MLLFIVFFFVVLKIKIYSFFYQCSFINYNLMHRGKDQSVIKGNKLYILAQLSLYHIYLCFLSKDHNSKHKFE